MHNYVHFSSACKGLLSEFQKGGNRTLLDVVEGITLTSHAGSDRKIEKTTIYSRYPSRSSGGYVHFSTKLRDMYPNFDDMIEFAAKLTSRGEYEHDIEILMDPDFELTYLNQ